ncbi:cointegrate resolution protein, partial [Bordetella avium]
QRQATEQAQAATQAAQHAAHSAEREGREHLAAAQQAFRDDLAQAEARHASHERRWLTELDAQRQTVRRQQEERELADRAAATREAELAAQLQTARDEARRTAELLASNEAEARAAQLQWEARLAADSQAAALQREALMQRNVDLETSAAQLRAQLAVKDSQIASLLAASRLRLEADEARAAGADSPADDEAPQQP